jgi:hypothetical protein
MGVELHPEEILVLGNHEASRAAVRQKLAELSVELGTTALRAKPLIESYGCYGHVSGDSTQGKYAKELHTGLEKRGPYIVQPEKETPTVIDTETGAAFKYIDRNFFTTDGKTLRFMTGYRCLSPIDSEEAKKGRLHGNKSTRWVKIAPEADA